MHAQEHAQIQQQKQPQPGIQHANPGYQPGRGALAGSQLLLGGVEATGAHPYPPYQSPKELAAASTAVNANGKATADSWHLAGGKGSTWRVDALP